MLRGLDGVGAVDDVAAELDAEIASDGAGLGGAAMGGGVGADGVSGRVACGRHVAMRTVPTVMYFCYMGLLSLGFLMITGTVGFVSCLGFVRAIYGSVKID